MQLSYEDWLVRRNYKPTTVSTQLYLVENVEKYYGDLDEHYDRDELRSVIEDLQYSADDERQNKPNTSKIPIASDSLGARLGEFRRATVWYSRYRSEYSEDSDYRASIEAGSMDDATENNGQLFGLERDLQIALRAEIDQLEKGFHVIDEGKERSVASGRIDITAKDAAGSIVVIELKAGTARGKDVGQVAGYMGDIVEEESGKNVRGILVAADFDQRAKSAAKVIPGLSLRAYSFNFGFTEV